MDRPIVYPGAIPQDTDVLSGQRNTMTALGWLLQSVMGTGAGVSGLACTPTSPASMVVNVGAGAIWALESIDATAYGSLASDTSPLMKMGINPEGAGTNFTLTAPTTSGDSINYLIQAAFSEADGAPVVLPYVNPANPSSPYSGPANSGTAQNTLRTQAVALQLKAGVAAATGTQTTPAVDTGYVGLYVITVAYGQSTVTAGNISVYPGAPFFGDLPNRIQSGASITANDTGSVNAYAATLEPAPAALTPGMMVHLQNILHTNTAASTLNVNGFGALPIQSAGGTALQAGELAIGYGALLALNHAGTAWTLLQTTGGPLPVLPGTQTQHAVNLGQFAKNLGTTGYQKLPSGLIIQWGGYTTSTNPSQSVTFPLAFPNGPLVGFAAQANATSANWGAGNPDISAVENGTWNATSMTIYTLQWTGSGWAGANGLGVNWLVIGN